MQLPCHFGKYLLLERIASGGMAEVFRARVRGAENFQRLVAIKRILPHLLQDEQFTRMFIDEAKLASLLNHSNIVHIYELGKHNGQLYIAMELIHGRDLRHITKKSTTTQQPLPLSFAAYVIAKAAEGLDFAHKKTSPQGTPLELVHRDVSPQNILVSYDGEVKVVDFGIAKATERSNETQAGFLKGKFGYVSPEQAQGAHTDHRSDIYGLGICLYETLSGQKLFVADSEMAVLDLVKEGALPDFRTTLPNLPEAFYSVLSKALAKDPTQRYQHASELAEALEPFLIDTQNHFFAAKQAAQVMHTLYDAEILDLRTRMAAFSEIDDETIQPENNTDNPEYSFSITEPNQDKSRVTSFARKTTIVPLPKKQPNPWPRALFKPPYAYGLLLLCSLAALATILNTYNTQTHTTALPTLRTAPLPSPTINPPQPKPTPVPTTTHKPSKKTATPHTDVYGYVSIKAHGATNTLLYIDHQKAGYSPLIQLKIKEGTHTLEAKEVIDDIEAYRSTSTTFTVTREHTFDKPLKLTVGLGE